MTIWLSIFAVAALAFISWNLYRRFGAGRISSFTETRRATSRFVGRGETPAPALMPAVIA